MMLVVAASTPVDATATASVSARGCLFLFLLLQANDSTHSERRGQFDEPLPRSISAAVIGDDHLVRRAI